MSKFRLEHHQECPEEKIVFETDNGVLSDLLDTFRRFLLACGYRVEGNVEIVEYKDQDPVFITDCEELYDE